MAKFTLPRDGDGQIMPHDHPDLQGKRRIIRGVVSRWHVVQDANRGCRRLSSSLFSSNPGRQDYLSFVSEFCLQSRNEDPAAYISDSEWDGAVAISVERFRSFDPAQTAGDRWKIGMVPLDNEVPPNPCHGAVWGNISKSKANEIRRSTEWLVPVPDVVIDEETLPLLGGKNGN